ncbi:hypothetical protein RGQ29_026553 [Quercus rubra]|uniref:Uncharacterized protein n=1 Tax=Quercus rubra TaxID=3512 RepID=A0AAN7ELZ9_QUERU|nr:hypothetical protein RGQ29_026553 [Quercus rubra]
MAETAVSSLIDRLLQLLTQEAKLLGGIHGEVADIKDELESIQSFLKDADAKAAAEQDIDDGVKTWVKQVREVAFHIDIAIDQYLLQVALHDPHPSGFRGTLQKTTHLLKTIIPRHKIAAKIQEIKALVQKINERSKRYGFQSSAQGSCSGARNELISWLVGGSPNRTVVSVVGMGGLGKTTLAKKVYDNQMVKGHFDCHAWISVSQSYKIEDLLRNIIKQFYEGRKEPPLSRIDAMDEQLLANKLRDYLQQKRYVVVFDDVWKIAFWDSIKNSLLDNHIGGRIMITTRNSEVANYCKKSSHVRVYKLQPLPWDKAWELFCKRAFQFDFEGQCPKFLVELSHDIVEKCGGLPLAIVAISGLLSTKEKNMFEWKNLLDSLGSEFGRNPHLSSVNKILSLSFEDLPYNLKSCFLYLGMYPEDYSINCVRLIRQWIAEGFVKEIEELIHRSLVQVSEVKLDGKIVLQKIKDLSFCHVLLKQESSFEGLIQRMSVNKVSYNVLKGFKDKKIHSLLLFNLDELPKSFMSHFFLDFKFLKVMDFEEASLDHIPKDVGSLFHLRYLSLRNTQVKKLPKSIGKLQNLETLDLKQTLVFELPIEINRLHKLRHLLAYYHDHGLDFSLASQKGVKIQKGVGCLEELQKLYFVDLNHGGVDLVKDMGKLRQLRKLGVKNLSKETMRALCASIAMMNRLQSLDIASISEDEIIDLQSISTPPQYLQRLYIKGHLEKFPDWIPKLQHLVKLGIYWSKLNEDPMKALQNLPNLLELEISRQAYNGEQLHIKIGGFPKLKILNLQFLNALHSLMIDEGALPLLEKFVIGRSPQLKEVPYGIRHLKNLKELRFIDMHKEFDESLDPELGSHYWIIEHIPVVYLLHKFRTGFYDLEARILRSKHLIGS